MIISYASLNGRDEGIHGFLIPFPFVAHDEEHGGAVLDGEGGDLLAHGVARFVHALVDGDLRLPAADDRLFDLHQFEFQAAASHLLFDGLA